MTYAHYPQTAEFLSLTLLGALFACSAREKPSAEEAQASVSQALTQSQIIVCTGACAEAFGGVPSSKFPVYYATRTVTPTGGANPESVVAAAFLMKCGANMDQAAKAFGYDPRRVLEPGIDQLERVEDLATLQARLDGKTPVALDCATSPFFQVFRRIDNSHSAASPGYYVQLRPELIEEAAAQGGERPAAIYGLDCANTLTVLWDGWDSGQQPDAILSNRATPINEAVLREWTATRGMTLPTLFCGTTASFRTELPSTPPKNVITVPTPTSTGAELYFVRATFDGVSTGTSGAFYLISNGLGYAIDGCGANINALAEALGLSADAEIPELPTSDPKFVQSNPNGQPVLRCDDARARVFESVNPPSPYRYFAFGADGSSGLARFSCQSAENFFLGGLSNVQPTQLPEEALAFLSGSGTKRKVFDVGCAQQPALHPLRLSSDVPSVLEVQNNGEWRAVCGHYFGIEEAEVACRQMGYAGVASFRTDVTKDSTAYWLDALNCAGSEQSLGDCERYGDHQDWGSHDCGEGDHVTITCSERATSFAAIRTIAGEEWTETSSGWFRTEPLLEAYYRGEWRGICDDLFGLTEAKVACRELGQGGVASLSTAVTTSSASFWLGDLDCTGSEARLSDCRSAGLGTQNCGNNEHIRLVCDPNRTTLPARLNNSILEVNYGGSWQGVCDDGFDIGAATVACWQLGYCGVASLTDGVYTDSSAYWLDDIACSGTEERLFDCSHRALGNHDCGINEHIRLTCDSSCSVVPLHNDPILEAYDYDEWLGICDDDFDMADAQVACRQLGFGRAIGFETEVSGESDLYRFDDLACTGNELRLSDCPHVGIEDEDCDEEEHVRVECE